MRSAQRLAIVALAAAAAASLLARRRRPPIGDSSTNGSAERTRELRRQIQEAREQLRRDLERAGDG